MFSSSSPALIPQPSSSCSLLPLYLSICYVFTSLSSFLPSSLYSFAPLPFYLLWFHVFVFLSSFPSSVIAFSSFTSILFFFFSCLHLPLELSFLLSSFTPLTLTLLCLHLPFESRLLLFHLFKSFDY